MATKVLSPHLNGIVNSVEEATLELLAAHELKPTDQLKFGVYGDTIKGLITSVPGSSPSIRAKTWVYRMPGVSEFTRKPPYSFKAPLTDVNCLVILAVWGISKIEFEDDEAELQFRLLITRFASQRLATEVQARYAHDGTIPEGAPIGNPKLPLSGYQRVAAWCAVKAENYALFMEQGTGKTAVSIAVMDELSHKADRSLFLITCPRAVMTNWQLEINNFSTEDHEVFVMRGGDLDRKKTFIEALAATSKKKWVACIISYETMVNSSAWLKHYNWDLHLMDESHYFKSDYSKRWGCIRELRNFSKRRMILTGTPIVNTASDLWTQLEFLGVGFSGFNTFRSFRSFYGNYIDGGGSGYQIYTGMRNVPLLRERLSRLAFSITKKKALPELPDKSYDVIDVTMSKQQQALYKTLAEQLQAEIENDLASSKLNNKVTANNALTKLLRLAQITSGHIKLDDFINDKGELVKGDVERFDPNPKLEQLVEIVKNTPKTSKLIIWAVFIQDIRTIAARLRLEGIECVTYYGATSAADRQIAVDRFNNDSAVQVFVGNPTAGGTGINLLGNSDEDTACDHEIYFSQGWSSAVRSQSEDRAHRRGTKRPVQITDLCVVDSIDFTIRDRVMQKRLSALEVQDVRSILREIVKGGGSA